MINLTKDEFAQVIHEVIKEFDMPDITFALVTIGAMIGARAEMKTESKEKCEAVVEYNAGRWNISIITTENDKVRLIVKRDGVVAVDRVLDSLHTAYNYAFNIISI